MPTTRWPRSVYDDCDDWNQLSVHFAAVVLLGSSSLRPILAKTSFSLFARSATMTFRTCYRMIGIAAGVLLLGIPGCGFGPSATTPVATNDRPEPVATTVQPEMPESLPVTTVTAAEMATTVSPQPTQKPYRNPFRPPTVRARTVTPQQAESADIRLLGIAKRDSQHIALLETAGEFHKAIVGDFVEQWEVLSVTESETTLRRGLEQMSLRIR